MNKTRELGVTKKKTPSLRLGNFVFATQPHAAKLFAKRFTIKQESADAKAYGD